MINLSYIVKFVEKYLLFPVHDIKTFPIVIKRLDVFLSESRDSHIHDLMMAQTGQIWKENNIGQPEERRKG
jgi:hypothetical protein